MKKRAKTPASHNQGRGTAAAVGGFFADVARRIAQPLRHAVFEWSYHVFRILAFPSPVCYTCHISHRNIKKDKNAGCRLLARALMRFQPPHRCGGPPPLAMRGKVLPTFFLISWSFLPLNCCPYMLPNCYKLNCRVFKKCFP